MTGDELLTQFRQARAKGWRVTKDVLPEFVPEPFFPKREDIFRALECVSPSEVKFLILGQDPYFVSTEHGEPAATGIAFAVNDSYLPRPTSLTRIMTKVYGKGNGLPSLLDWVEEKGILLLNAALTVPRPDETRSGRQCAGGHLALWSAFTKAIVTQVKQASPNVQMVAWGCDARDTLCKALGEDWRSDDCSVAWSYHPVASSAGARSFTRFWDTPVGKSLRK